MIEQDAFAASSAIVTLPESGSAVTDPATHLHRSRADQQCGDDPQGRRAPAIAPSPRRRPMAAMLSRMQRRSRAAVASSSSAENALRPAAPGRQIGRARPASVQARARPPRCGRAARDCARSTRAPPARRSSTCRAAGSRLRATPSTTTMVFCSITSSVRVVMSNSAGDLEQQRQQLRHRDLVGACGRGSARRWRGSPGRNPRPNDAAARSRPRNAPRRPAGSRGG